MVSLVVSGTTKRQMSAKGGHLILIQIILGNTL